jgi:acyl-lipid (8-3)-desaturase
VLITNEHPTFRPLSQFYTETRRLVSEKLRELDIDPHHSVVMLMRCALLVLLLVGAHFASLYVYAQSGSYAVACALQVVVGVCGALLSLMPVHEGSHFALTHRPWVWRLLGATHDFVNGASFYNWLHQHFLGHHPYTSLEDTDPDIYTGDPDARRIKPSQGYLSIYRFQHLYVPPLYGVLAAKFRVSDLALLFVGKGGVPAAQQPKNGALRVNPPESFHWACFLLGKLTWFAYRWALPAYLLGWLPATVLLVVSDLCTSYYLALVFQVNHVTRGLDWPQVGEDGVVDMDWAHMQVVTTIDYAHDSPLTTFLSGGLNFQAVHHLFPHISQIYYPEIAPLIKAQCKKYHITYKYKPTFWAALVDHIGYLKDMGSKHQKVHSH